MPLRRKLLKLWPEPKVKEGVYMSDKMSQNEIDMLINQYSDKKQEEQQIKDSNNIINGTPDKKQSKAKQNK